MTNIHSDVFSIPSPSSEWYLAFSSLVLAYLGMAVYRVGWRSVLDHLIWLQMLFWTASLAWNRISGFPRTIDLAGGWW